MTSRLATIAFFAAIVFAALTAPALASVESVYHGGTYWGHDIIVEPGQVVKGDITVVGGDATIEGVVDGDIDIIGGNFDPRPGAIVTGQVNTVGGDVAGLVMPWSQPERPSGDARLLWRIAWDVLAVLFFLVFPLRTRAALERLETHPGLCAAFGVLGWIAVVPLAVLLLCTILLIPFIAVEAVVVIAAVFLGKAALALLVGRRLCEVLSPKSTPSPFTALVAGLALITAAELVPVLGAIVTAFVLLIGLGAAILAFTGEHVIASAIPAAPSPEGPPRPPLSGPPMPVG